MCGFAGYYNLTRQNFTIDQTLLDRMQQSIAHRGPDAFGFWKSDAYHLGLTARRLSIIDLSAAGNQPMFDAHNKVVLCFNGEIYNHAQIRKELEQLGYTYSSTADTQTIIHAYKEWGIQSMSRFEGMFALALFDLEKHKLYLVRDRIGIKPLYFAVQGGILSFASEIKALWQLPWNEKKINPLAWYHYLTFMVAPAPWTIFEGVYKLPAGFYAEVDAQKRMSFTEWYSPVTKISRTEKKEYFSETFCISRIKELLLASTQKRMIADVPVGAYLSGGLDSSLNVALMSQYTEQLKTFTIAIAGDAHHELIWARRVAQIFGTDHHEMVISEQEAFHYYHTMLSQLDEPLADCVCIPFYYVSAMAHRAGMKVVQVGEGADELFFGYHTYLRYAQFYNRFWRPAAFMPQFMRKGLAHVAHALVAANPLKAELLDHWARKENLFWGGALAFGSKQKQLVFNHQPNVTHDAIVDHIYPGMQQTFDSHAIIEYHRTRLLQQHPEADFYQQMLYIELKQRLPELLLMRADKMSMAMSIEAREPYLDHKLVEFMYHVPGQLKFKNGVSKYLLKKVAHGILPDDIIYRKKVGFGAPTAQWLEQGQYFSPYFHHVVQDKIDKTMNSNADHRAVQNWVLQQMQAFLKLMR